MGFFSKIKQFWSGDAKPTEQASSPVHASDTALQGDNAAWRNELTLALRQAEPRLSQWLEVITTDVAQAGPVLDERLLFLFEALGAPVGEAKDFVSRFNAWLEQMGYRKISEFRSELQYRLALALDLEDEEDERDRLFLKLSEGIAKTKAQITQRIDTLISSHGEMNDAFWNELEEILIMADVGFEASQMLLKNLQSRARKSGLKDSSEFRELLKAELEDIFKAPPRIQAVNPPEVVMMVGVNGVGKTTTIAKLAHRAQMQGRKVLIAAGDTFRAAAIEQLEVWAKRVGADFFAKQAGSDPAAVAFEAMDMAIAGGYDLVLLDTAGRLHTKANLMEELEKIKRVVGKKHPGAPHRSILVIDATTGQNALSQTKLFNEAVHLDELILTKLDGTAKGGVVVAVALQFKVPITFVGLGEKMEDLRPFDGRDFAKALLT
ncbi:MAG: signal recognition particle-docking protein FtsY [Desulfovibrionaceae bacterium]